MLREMTSSAFAHPFKRIAQLAVFGIALAGLTACGGGGGGGEDEGPGPCPAGQVRGEDNQCRLPACPAGQVRGEDDQCQLPACPQGQVRGEDDQCRLPACPQGQVRGEDDQCQLPACPQGQVRGEDDQCQLPACPQGQVRGEDDQCQLPACPQGQVRGEDDQCQLPACPQGQVRGEDDQCQLPACPQGQVRGEDDQCQLPACPQGQVRGEDDQCQLPACPQGQVRGEDDQCMVEMLNEYGSVAYAMNPWRAAFWSEVRTSRTAARDAAVAACEKACTSSSCDCQEVLWFQNACGSLAFSSDTHRAGVGWGETESAAEEEAKDRCREAEGQGCTISPSSSGTATFCAKAGSATPSGQASPIPPRPCPAGQVRREDGQCPPPPCPAGQEREGDGPCMMKPALGGGSLDDVNVTLPASCPRQIEMCVRDYDCEDGDKVRVTVNRVTVFEGELRTAEQCVNVPVNTGENTVNVLALNGTGGKGSCSQANLNTGEIKIHGQKQVWQHPQEEGSSANISLTIGPAGGSCDAPVIPAPPNTASYLAIYYGISGTSSPSRVRVGSSAEAAEISAKAHCEHVVGASCQVGLRGYTNACGAVATSDSVPPPFLGFGMSESRQGAKDLARQDCERKAEGTAVSGTCRDRGSSRGGHGASASILRITSSPSISSGHNDAAFCSGDWTP